MDAYCHAESDALAAVAVTDQDFIALVRSHRQRLYSFILRNIGHPTDAEDLTQQTFIEAYRALSSFRGQAELSTWLLGIAMNLVRNYLGRSPHRRHRILGDEVLDTMPGDDPQPDEMAGWTEAMEQLSDELGALAPELRQVLMLVAVDGIAYDEAATLLTIPIGTVRSRVSRARAALRKRLPEVVNLIE